MKRQRTCLEYVWISPGHNGSSWSIRSKTKVFDYDNLSDIMNPSNLPLWNFDGSSTNQANGEDSEVVIKPAAVFSDPFRPYNGFIVLCDTYLPNGDRHPTNTRYPATQIFNKFIEEKPWYGLEQEYFIMKPGTNESLGSINCKEQGRYYCSVGADNAYGRDIAEHHLQVCLDAGINISGINAEVAPGQWEFQIGPCEGINQGDHMWVARYLLQRIGEMYNVTINFEPKPMKGELNGSGCHVNFSTHNMRNGTDSKTGLEFIDDAIKKLSEKHSEHMDVYGAGNEERMTGEFETAAYNVFSDGIANRGCSIRRGNETYKNQKGYFEDRRPSSNCDPYLVTSKIFDTITS